MSSKPKQPSVIITSTSTEASNPNKTNIDNFNDAEVIKTLKDLKKKIYDNALAGKPNPNPFDDVGKMIADFEAMSRSKASEQIIEVLTLLSASCEEAATRGLRDRDTYYKCFSDKCG